jgi:hypothetical protein
VNSMDKPRTIIGIFTEKDTANAAVSDLNSLQVDSKDISVMVRDLEWAHQVVKGKDVKVVESAATGVGTGVALGALTGLLVGIGAITLPGIGAFFIGGPIATALGLTGAAATAVSAATSGAVAGGLVGSLVGLGLPAEVAQVYEEKIKEGAVILAVAPRSMDDERLVREVFERRGAQAVHVLNA